MNRPVGLNFLHPAYYRYSLLQDQNFKYRNRNEKAWTIQQLKIDADMRAMKASYEKDLALKDKENILKSRMNRLERKLKFFHRLHYFYNIFLNRPTLKCTPSVNKYQPPFKRKGSQNKLIPEEELNTKLLYNREGSIPETMTLQQKQNELKPTEVRSKSRNRHRKQIEKNYHNLIQFSDAGNGETATTAYMSEADDIHNNLANGKREQITISRNEFIGDKKIVTIRNISKSSINLNISNCSSELESESESVSLKQNPFIQNRGRSRAHNDSYQSQEIGNVRNLNVYLNQMGDYFDENNNNTNTRSYDSMNHNLNENSDYFCFPTDTDQTLASIFSPISLSHIQDDDDPSNDNNNLKRRFSQQLLQQPEVLKKLTANKKKRTKQLKIIQNKLKVEQTRTDLEYDPRFDKEWLVVERELCEYKTKLITVKRIIQYKYDKAITIHQSLQSSLEHKQLEDSVQETCAFIRKLQAPMNRNIIVGNEGAKTAAAISTANKNKNQTNNSQAIIASNSNHTFLDTALALRNMVPEAVTVKGYPKPKPQPNYSKQSNTIPVLDSKNNDYSLNSVTAHKTISNERKDKHSNEIKFPIITENKVYNANNLEQLHAPQPLLSYEDLWFAKNYNMCESLEHRLQKRHKWENQPSRSRKYPTRNRQHKNGKQKSNFLNKLQSFKRRFNRLQRTLHLHLYSRNKGKPRLNPILPHKLSQSKAYEPYSFPLPHTVTVI